MMCQRTHWIAMVMVTAMLASGCAVFRRQPAQEPVPPPPPVIVESRPPQEPAEVPRHGLLTRSAMVVSVGLEAGGDALLEEFLRSGPAVGPEARSRALVLRALLVLHQGGERGGRMAKAYLQAAGQADPGGGNAGGIALALDLLVALERERGELARSRAQLGASRDRERRQSDAETVLRTQVESLELQLEELKAIHLQIESGKEDTPSP
ncbi:MAG: hypothetical protein O7C74_05680 [Acidobacteria bacterium]|nr:hypothetical protein [Acidobacteriota bacterium]